MIITRTIQIEESTIEEIRDRVINTFWIGERETDPELTDAQIEKLISLCPDYDGSADTDELDRLLDAIAKYFLKMPVPCEVATLEYKDKFEEAMLANKPKFNEFLKPMTKVPDRVLVKCSEMEFFNEGNTITINTIDQNSILRIKCSGQINTRLCQEVSLSQSVLLVDGDINIYISADQIKESK